MCLLHGWAAAGQVCRTVSPVRHWRWRRPGTWRVQVYVCTYVCRRVWVDGWTRACTYYIRTSIQFDVLLSSAPALRLPPRPLCSPAHVTAWPMTSPTTTTTASPGAASHCPLPRLECTPRGRTAKTCSFDRQPARRFNMKIALWAITCGLGLDSPSHCAFSLPHKCTQEPRLSPSSARPCPCVDSRLGPLRQYAAVTRAM